MRRKMIGMVLVLAAGTSLAGWFSSERPVTVRSLLAEMVDREEMARFPEPAYTSRQFSSYDRGSVAPDQPGWYANNDFSHFLRVETNGVRREHVMVDTAGPGALVRFWVTVAGTDGSGILRVYLDGRSTPEIEGPVLEVLSGSVLCGYPLAASVSEHTDYLKRGHNLYLPIPYAARCVVTYESATLGRGECFYYNAECRTYPTGTAVESFSLEAVRRDVSALSEVRRALVGGGLGVDRRTAREIRLDGVLAPGASVTHTVEGARAVRLLTLALNGGRDDQALRSTVIEMAFDGVRTVWIPAGEFFGTGYRLAPSRTWYTQVSRGGLMESAWVMPFRRRCELTLHNLGTNAVAVTQGVLMTAPWRWDSRSMYFGAGWTEYRHEPVRVGPDGHHDLNYVTLQGEGVLAGTGVTLFNTVRAWWGEGDEKIFVDGETFPSFIGTGSEDYYGYAWSNPNVFTHPFLAQPVGDGAKSEGLVVNVRHRALDRIPFRSSLRFDMELWHHRADAVINYAPSACWYMKPGGRANRGPEPDRAAQPVARMRRDIIPLKMHTEGVIEGEDMEATASRGHVSVQDGHKDAGWSGGKQLWWRDGRPGDVLTLTFGMSRAGRYALTLGLTHANDYGIADIALNGKRLITAYDAFAEKVETHVVQAGIVELVQGENVLTVTLTGANPKTKKDNFMQGVDRLELVSAERGTQNVERQRDYPPVEAVLTNLNITVNSVTNLAETLQTEYARQYPGGPPLKFSVYLRDSFKPSEWKELGPNYHVCAVSNHTSPELKFRLSVPAITVAEVLSVVSDNSKWNWWTYRDEVIIEPSVPMFQPSLLNYDAPGAGDALKVVLAHLFSDIHALSDARMYLGDLGQGKSPVLRRIVLPRSSLPDGFIPPDVGVPFEICEKHHDLVTGELLVRVHRVLSRGPDGFRVDLFVTGADSIGGGWFTYTLTKLDELWKPKYCGFYDP
ncbi:MAG TPA: DUF2961 domain-containing protein [Kiritimatiellia bacterium]|nr:DUF2961 domain-containing protein [Kiritimatiellia bacterium]